MPFLSEILSKNLSFSKCGTPITTLDAPLDARCGYAIKYSQNLELEPDLCLIGIR